MTGLALSFVLQAALLANGAQPYNRAFYEAEATGRPLLVLVGADWCPGCRTMKQSVLPQMVQSGRLNQVSLSVVNTDAESVLASRLMRGSSIPQLIVFSKTDKGWHREQINGAVNPATVEALIGRAVAAQHSARAAHSQPTFSAVQPTSSAVGN